LGLVDWHPSDLIADGVRMIIRLRVIGRYTGTFDYAPEEFPTYFSAQFWRIEWTGPDSFSPNAASVRKGSRV
jgi:hypothetical protein